MNWANNLSTVEYTFLILFFLLYALFFGRVWWVARKFNSSSRSVIAKFLLRSTYFGLLIAALLGPTFGNSDATSQALGRDLYLAVDLSNSMNANDTQPSRLERAKFELLSGIDDLENYRVGLIIFGTDAFVITPLTYDLMTVKQYIQQLNTRLLVDAGTSLNSVLDLVLNKYQKTPNAERIVKSVLVVTDGEDFTSLPNATLKRLRDEHLNVLFLGMGTYEGSRIPVGKTFLKDKDGDVVISKYSETEMRRIAPANHIFHLQRNEDKRTGLIATLNALRNTQIDERKFIVQNNRYYYFLWIALFLITLDIIVTIRIIKV